METQAGFQCYSLEAGFLLLWKTSVFALKGSADWMRLTHIMEDNLLSLKSTDHKNGYHLQNTFTETSRLVFDQTTRHHSLVKLPHKINHCPLLGTFYCIISLNPHNNL